MSANGGGFFDRESSVVKGDREVCAINTHLNYTFVLRCSTKERRTDVAMATIIYNHKITAIIFNVHVVTSKITHYHVGIYPMTTLYEVLC